MSRFNVLQASEGHYPWEDDEEGVDKTPVNLWSVGPACGHRLLRRQGGTVWICDECSRPVEIEDLGQ